MTDFTKVEKYYQDFDEWGRLEVSSGKLEFELTMDIILNNISDGDEILDLGGGPGHYTIELAKCRYDVHLADLSDALLNEAKEKINEIKLNHVKSIRKVNAIDLSAYKAESFDVVLLLGPLYHLTRIDERKKCLKEVYRVLKPKGVVIASFIPYLSGAIGIVDRYFRNSNQVDEKNLVEVFDSGVFNNNAENGFQEGYYPTSEEIIELFKTNGFKQKLTRSIRGFGYMREEKILNLKEKNKKLYEVMIQQINETAQDASIIETCGHAIYIGSK